LTHEPPRYASVIMDVDSTLCGVEGIDWLAARRSIEVAEQSLTLTRRAMNGEVPLEKVYGERLGVIRPSLRDITALSQEYRRTLAPHAKNVIARLRDAGVELILVSGGIRRAIEPLAVELGFARDDLHAVELRWDVEGEYVGFDTESPLTTQKGKLEIVRSARLATPALAIGDGATDVEMRSGVDAFAAFTGFVRRENIVARADFALKSFEDLLRRVLSEES
jgi:phosphoserine phosphatase